MALITCPECQKEISDKATACINCGNPIEKMENQAKTTNKNQYTTKDILIGPFFVIVVSFVILSLLPDGSSEARIAGSVIFIIINTLMLVPLFDKTVTYILKAYLVIIYLIPLSIGIIGIIKDSQ
jgi:hypothetical protein